MKDEKKIEVELIKTRHLQGIAKAYKGLAEGMKKAKNSLDSDFAKLFK